MRNEDDSSVDESSNASRDDLDGIATNAADV